MLDYSKSKIYKIWSHLGDGVYYGSTTRTLSNRMAGHRGSTKLSSGSTTANILFEKYGIENCKIELVELYPCQTVEELRKREGEYIRNNDCVNKMMKGSMFDISAYNKKQYIKHREQRIQSQKEYYNDNKEIFKEVYIKNREKRIQYQKEYREKRDLTPEQKVKQLQKENELLKEEIRLLKENA